MNMLLLTSLLEVTRQLNPPNETDRFFVRPIQLLSHKIIQVIKTTENARQHYIQRQVTPEICK